jgi:drug/metabolite transporter (DMT)-like permease
MSPSAGFGALLLAATSISLGVIAVKHGYASGADPEAVLAARLLVAAPLAALALPFLLRRGPRLPPRALAGSVAAGVLMWIGVRGVVEGLARLPAGALALVLATAPVFVVLIDWALTRRVPSRFDRGTIVAIALGVAIMAAPVGSSVSLLGVLGGLVSALAFATFLTVIDRARVPVAAALPLGMIGAGLTVLITDPSAAPGLADELPLWLVAVLGVTAALVVACEPGRVTVLAVLILGEGHAGRQVVGGLVVVGALTALAARIRAEAAPAS